MADFGFRRDIGNSRLDIEFAGNDVLQISSTQIVLPARMTGGIEVADYGTVTQTTGLTTAVSVNALAGAITLASVDLAAGAEATFTVNNTRVEASDIVSVCVQTAASEGEPLPYVSAVAANSFDLSISNVHASATGIGGAVIGFIVHKASA